MMLEHWLKPVLDPGPQEYFDLGDFRLTTGYTLRNAKLAYRTYGDLESAKGKAIIFPLQFTGTSESMAIFIGPGRPLDPTKYLIILPGQFSDGFSSSPSNTPPPFNQGAFPPITYADDVIAQRRLVTERFNIRELYAVLGWSGGALQTYEWAVRYPSMVKRAAAFSGTAKTPVHTQILLSRLAQELLRSDPAWSNGFYADPHAVQVGLRRHSHVFSLMALTPEFYREETWSKVGFGSPGDFIAGIFEAQFLALDPNNLLSQLDKALKADVGVNANGDLAAALARITAKTFVVPFVGDRIFTRKDCEDGAALIPNSQIRFIDSVWGHNTMLSPMEEDKKAIDQVLGEVLS
ncbi:MAG: alpha/beta fold hydrolase [Pseudonocardiaceae bacterium]